MVHRRLILFLVGFFFAIIAVAIMVRMTPIGREIGWLGIIGGRRDSCYGELKVTSRPADERCGLQADLTMYNCQGKKWYVFGGNSCSGNHICMGSINEQTSNWKCTWEADKGTYTFTLCADSDAKARSRISC